VGLEERILRHDVEVNRSPRPVLRPFVERVWALDETSQGDASLGRRREHVIPTGRMHLVFRLSDDPLHLFDDEHDSEGRTVSVMIVGGARTRFYVRDVSKPLCSVGAVLRPGAAEVLFGAHADELSGSHTALEDLWGRRATSMREELTELPSPEERLDAFERMLAARLPTVRGLHPAVAHALQQFEATTSVHDVVRHSGYSHRRFIELFSRTVGLTPKMYCRVLRFQQVLRAGTGGLASLIDVAMANGYSDQSHFNREFREFTGVTPTEYRQAAPRAPHHVLGDSR
jgi:AraC-like DNA-binding protein